MGLLRTYLYCLRQTGRALRRSTWTLLWPVALIGIYLPLSVLLSPLGFLGGFLLVLLYDAFLASLLFVVSELVRGSPVRLREMKSSAGPYFWPIMNVLFVLWIGRLVLGPLLRNQPNAEAMELAISAVLFVLLNAVPETLYLRGAYGGLATISASMQFIQRHWLEWLPPNALLGAALWFGLREVAAGPLWLWAGGALAGGALLHAGLVFRGFLFEALESTTPRQRELRERLGR